MSYKTYTEQILEHLAELQANNLDVTELTVDSLHWIRCHELGETRGRGDYAYIANSEKLRNGLLGIRTSYRGPKGHGSYQTYELTPSGKEDSLKLPHSHEGMTAQKNELHENAARKAYGFWKHSCLTGTSDYLQRKGVGSYGIRFRQSEQYGNVAVVPMFDEAGKLWSYQILNPDGKKRHPKDARTEGLFHSLRPLLNNQPIGIAESYVTSATCLELTNIPVVCAFSCHNLKAVAMAIRKLYPKSPLIIFADNDRHLPNGNQGLLKAHEARNAIKTEITLAMPDFGDLEPSKEASDWNDLLRLKGKEIVVSQITNLIH
ncbi:MAG: toprim domain-containing protein [Proteobacteria bacterium]|nr:toprim domain-containing protein [Pseudomonadota bacterium]